MLNALQANPSPSVAFRPQAARSQDSAGGIGILPGAPAGALRARVELLLDGSSLQAALMEAVHEARTSIKADLALLRGPEGRELARALARRARQGLRVQVLAHGPAGSQAFEDMIAAARGLGLVVRRATGTSAAGHGKALVVDDRLALMGVLGGPGQARGRRGLLRLAGEAAWELGRQFNHDWAAAGGHPLTLPELATLAHADGAALLLGGNGPARRSTRAIVLTALRRARRSIEVMADVLDDGEAIAALTQARRRGATVRVLLGDAAELDGLAARLGLDARLGAIAALAAAGVQVRLHQAAVGLRAAVIDGDTLVMGSLPWTAAGFAGSGEVVAEVRGDGAAALLRETFERDWETAAPPSLPGALRRAASAVAPAMAALSRLFAGRTWRMPELRVGVVKVAGRWKVVSEVR